MVFWRGFSFPLKLPETCLKEPRGSDREPKQDRTTTLCPAPSTTGIALSVLSGNTRHRQRDPFARIPLACMMDKDYSANNQVPSPRGEGGRVRSQPVPVKTLFFFLQFSSVCPSWALVTGFGDPRVAASPQRSWPVPGRQGDPRHRPGRPVRMQGCCAGNGVSKHLGFCGYRSSALTARAGSATSKVLQKKFHYRSSPIFTYPPGEHQPSTSYSSPIMNFCPFINISQKL